MAGVSIGELIKRGPGEESPLVRKRLLIIYEKSTSRNCQGRASAGRTNTLSLELHALDP